MSYIDRYLDTRHRKLSKKYTELITDTWRYFARQRINALHRHIHGLETDGGENNLPKNIRDSYTEAHRRLGTHNHAYRRHTH